MAPQLGEALVDPRLFLSPGPTLSLPPLSPEPAGESGEGQARGRGLSPVIRGLSCPGSSWREAKLLPSPIPAPGQAQSRRSTCSCELSKQQS